MSRTELLQRALELPEAEREQLGNQILDSLEGNGLEPETQKAWAAELEARMREVESGQVQLQDWDEALAEMRHAVKETPMR